MSNTDGRYDALENISSAFALWATIVFWGGLVLALITVVMAVESGYYLAIIPAIALVVMAKVIALILEAISESISVIVGIEFNTRRAVERI